MGRLIKNELIKIFKKKSLYITLIIIFAFMIFTNCMYKGMNNNYYYYGYEYSEENVNYLKEQLKALDPEKSSDISLYIDTKSQIDMYEMMKEYEYGSWQQQIIGEKLSNYFREKNMYQYGEEKDEQTPCLHRIHGGRTGRSLLRHPDASGCGACPAHLPGRFLPLSLYQFRLRNALWL